MSMEELKKQLNENRIGKLYLFTGTEQYLIRYYEREITHKILQEDTRTFNYTVLEGKVTLDQLSDAVSVFPAFSERRVVVVRESTLLKAAGAKDSDWTGFFETLPDYICLIFIQAEVDKRISFYKSLKKFGLIVEFGQQSEAALTKWVMKVFASYKKQISENDAAFFVSLLDPDMTFMLLEVEKVARFMGDQTRVTREMILAVASKSVKSRIFDLTDAISLHQTANAIRIVHNLLELKEPVPYIIAMVGRQMGILMKTKRMEEKKLSPAEMAKMLGVPPFIAGKIRKQASSFSMETLRRFTRMCMETDMAVKTGRMDDRLALDLLLVGMGISKEAV